MHTFGQPTDEFESVWEPGTSSGAGTTTDSLPRRADVVIAGAGVAGMACAIRLVEAGLDVVVLDPVGPAAGTTGASSAKVSIVHELHAHRIARLDGSDMAREYLHANQFGLDWIVAQIERADIDCGWERRRGITYVTQQDNADLIDREVATFRDAGIAAERADIDLPFETHGAVVVSDQGQLDPVRFVRGLADRFTDDGGTIVTGVRATGVDDGRSGATVSTTGGEIECRWFIVATGLPFLDRGLYFARTEPQSSYVVACEVESMPPDGMYLSADGPTRSMRSAVIGDRRLLLVGGEGHKTGQGGDTRERAETLVGWTAEHFGLVDVVARFSAHDYTTPDLRPFVGPIHRGSTSTLVMTGFNKWGFTNAAAGTEVLASRVLDEPAPTWADVFSTARLPTSGVVDLAKANANVGVHLAGGWVAAMRSHDGPEPGEGRVTRRGVHPIAVSSDRTGKQCEVSGVCTHLGGIVAWNPAEQTWDCPLHGSRFARSGSMLHGPAVTDLEVPRDTSSEEDST